MFLKNNKFLLRMTTLVLTFIMLLPLLVGCAEEPDENEIAVNWHLGMVTSNTHEKKETLLDGEELYAYSDIIHLAKPGTMLTFTVSAESVEETADTDVYVFSHWIEQDGAWVLANPGDHYAGNGDRRNEFESYDEEGNIVYTYISTFEDEYVRLCYLSGQKAGKRRFNYAKVYQYETDYDGTLTRDASLYRRLKLENYITQSKKNAWYDNLKGLTIYCLGDSYFDDPAVKNRMWVDLLDKKYDLNLQNYGISGSTVSNCPGEQSSYGMQPGQPKAFNPMCLRIEERMPANGTPDIILFDGGRNDFTKEVPLGELDSMDEGTFRGAINSCIAKLKERYPNALIIGITCWNVDRTRHCDMVTQQEFGAAMKEQCAYNGIPCIDQIDETITGVHMNDGAFREQYCKTPTDISHLNEDGQMYYMPVPEKFIAEAYAVFKSGK